MPAPLLDEMLRFAAELRQHAADCLRDGDRRRYEKYSQRADAIEKAAADALTSAPDRTKVRDEMQAAAVPRPRKVGRPIEAAHPFPKALKKANVTVTEWAMAHGYKRERVKSWFADGDGGRPIPRKAADQIAVEYGLPASARTWPNGIKD